MTQKQENERIQEILTRGVVNILPDKQKLAKALASPKKLNVYLGIDPTATKIHLGHAVNLRKLQALVELGHHITFLIGDFTARVGDNSDKETERPLLTEEEIKENFRTYRKQAEKILDFSKVSLRHNSEWLEKLSFGEVLKLSQNFTLNDYIGREIMKRKLEKGVSVRLDELLYPLMQGYDSFCLDTDLQLGAADQTFNMQAGRTLLKRLKNKESFVLVNDYLIGTDGRKMSKSWGNAIWLEDNPVTMFGKVMSLKDELIEQYFLLGTKVALDKVKEVRTRLQSGENPMLLKSELAFAIVSEVWGEKSAQASQEEFTRVFQQDSLPTDIPEVEVKQSELALVDLLMELKLAESKAEVRSLVADGAVKIDGKTKSDSKEEIIIQSGLVVQVGKRRIAKVK